jgi:hypothetical protein
MRLLLTAIFLLTANGAIAFGEGRYVVTSTVSSLSKSPSPQWILTDTKTGKFRLCYHFRIKMACNPWFDGIDGVAQSIKMRGQEPEPAWTYIDK